MAFIDLTPDQDSSDPSSFRLPPPQFLSQSSRHQSSSVDDSEINSSSRRIRNRYKSAFTEIGLDEAADTTTSNLEHRRPTRPSSRVRWRSQVDIHEVEQQEEGDVKPEIRRTVPTTTWHHYGSSAAVLSRLSFVAVVLAIMIPVLHMSPLLYAGTTSIGAEAGPITPNPARYHDREPTQLSPRQDNPADACLRWSHQSAVVNGTLYLYGGRAKRDSNQDSNTWSELTPSHTSALANRPRQQLPQGRS